MVARFFRSLDVGQAAPALVTLPQQKPDERLSVDLRGRNESVDKAPPESRQLQQLRDALVLQFGTRMRCPFNGRVADSVACAEPSSKR